MRISDWSSDVCSSDLKSEVSNDLSTAAAAVKAYLDGNPAATLAVSGYNDPTGNAAVNAELSKNRAQSVKAALEKLGFASDRVVLEKPAETTISDTDNSAARAREIDPNPDRKSTRLNSSH